MFNVRSKRQTKYQEGFKFLTKVCPSISFLFYFTKLFGPVPHTLPLKWTFLTNHANDSHSVFQRNRKIWIPRQNIQKIRIPDRQATIWKASHKNAESKLTKDWVWTLLTLKGVRDGQTIKRRSKEGAGEEEQFYNQWFKLYVSYRGILSAWN